MADELDELYPRLVVLTHLQAEIAAAPEASSRADLLAEMRAIETELLVRPCDGVLTAVVKLKLVRDTLQFEGPLDTRRELIEAIERVAGWLRERLSAGTD